MIVAMLSQDSFGADYIGHIKDGMSGIVIYKKREFYGDELARSFSFSSADDRRPLHNLSIGYVVFTNEEETISASSSSLIYVFLDSDFTDANKLPSLRDAIKTACTLNTAIAGALIPYKQRLAALEARSQLITENTAARAPAPQPSLSQASNPAIDLPTTLVIDDIEYRGVLYISHDTSRVEIMHESGVASLLIGDLPDELHSLFEYNPAAATAAEVLRETNERRQREEEIRLAKLRELGIDIIGFIKQIVNKGEIVLYNTAKVTEKQKAVDKALGREPSDTVLLSKGEDVWLETSRDDLVEDDVYTGTIYPMGTIEVEETTTWHGLKLGDKTRVISRYTDKLWQAEAYHNLIPVTAR
jgi:hypothetical protein